LVETAVRCTNIPWDRFDSGSVH